MTRTHRRPRIAICGMAIESSTFSPHRSGWEAFTLLRGNELVRRYPFLRDGTALRREAEWVGILRAGALPGGAVPADVYETVRAEIGLALEAQGPFDGVLLEIHGAMSVLGYTDAEADLARAVRAAVGPDCLVSASMDLHGNVSRDLAATVDLIACHRTAPHEDEDEARERAATDLLRRVDGAGRPRKAWVQVPVLLAGERASTRQEPAKGIYEDVARVGALDGVLDASVWVGYAWADEPRCRAAVVVMGDDDAVISREAERLARRYWDARAEFGFVAPAGSYEECLRAVLASDARPFVLSDTGDNPMAGGAGDVTWTLARLLAEPAFAAPPADGGRTAIYAALPDADAARTVAAAGVGATVEVEAGARVDAGPHGPVTLRGVVEHVRADDPLAGIVCVVAVGGLRVVLTERRRAYHLESDFTAIGLDPRGTDVVVVKIGNLETELYEMAEDWMLVLTPGGVDQDLRRLRHTGLGGPVWPFDDDAAFGDGPDLTPELL
ncbi:M81 family metallopeptidase [Promicromonospora sp. NPDC050262]|uniref:M81 family metallopeptidase n=1 Tax=Promicromonospora sp. NPDC050262 TaxID=3155036 RepID=UPI0033E772CF